MPKKVLIALPPAMLEQVDYIAQCEHRTRSDLIREALRRYIDGYKRQHPISTIGELHAVGLEVKKVEPPEMKPIKAKVVVQHEPKPMSAAVAMRDETIKKPEAVEALTIHLTPEQYLSRGVRVNGVAIER